MSCVQSRQLICHKMKKHRRIRYQTVFGTCVIIGFLLYSFLYQEGNWSAKRGKNITSKQRYKGLYVKVIDKNTPNENFDVINNQLNKSSPVRHIAYLKVHKAASGTMQTLFLRFGIENDLIFVLPSHGTGLTMMRDQPISEVALPPPANRTYDIICSHIPYSRNEFKKHMPSDTVYIATVRDPFRQFISCVHFYHRAFMLNITHHKPILTFLQDPNKYKQIIRKSGRVSNLYNSMAYDFGFPPYLFVNPDKERIQKYIEELDQQFDLVLIVEYLDEGLILMRRLLNWDMRHLLYESRHVRKHPEPALAVGKEEEDLYRKWCLLDYALFEFFKAKFLKIWENMLVNSDVMAELIYFREMNAKVDEFCHAQLLSEKLKIEPSQWHKGFYIDNQYCESRLLAEKKQIDYLREKHFSSVNNSN